MKRAVMVLVCGIIVASLCVMIFGCACSDGTAYRSRLVGIGAPLERRPYALIGASEQPVLGVPVASAPPKPVVRMPVVTAPPDPVLVASAAPMVPRHPVAAGFSETTQTLPAKECGNPAVLLEKRFPRTVRAGEEFEYTIRVVNLTGCLIEEVAVVEQLPNGFVWRGSDPAANVGADKTATWVLGELAPNAVKTIRIRGVVMGVGEIVPCTRLAAYTNLCNPIEVVQPRLELTKTMPRQVLICDEIPVKMVVSNTGTGVARGVKVAETLPPGLALSGGGSTFVYDVGDLTAGASREVSYTARATKTGTYGNLTASAKSEAGLLAEATSSIIVRQPVLSISSTGPAQQYAGRVATYTIEVSNPGDVVATNVTVQNALPEGASLVRADGDQQLRDGAVTWNLGDLQPGARKTVSILLRGDSIGSITNRTAVTAYCVDVVWAETTTQFVGIAAILLEVIDSEDPVEVGQQERYVITATNQGTVSDTNIVISCTIEPNMEYVTTRGPTRASSDGRTITFAPLPKLAPQDSAVWEVVTKAIQAGDVRFKVQMTSDQLQRPVEETEATTLY